MNQCLTPAELAAALLTELLADYTERHADTLRSPETAKFHAYRVGPWIEGRRASEIREVAGAIRDDLLKAYKPATVNRSLGALKKALAIAWEQNKTTAEEQDLHPLELADRIDPGDEGSKCVLTIDLVHAADLIRRMHSAGIEQEREIATMAGQTAAIGHLSALVDEQRALLAEVERVCGVDEWGEKIHEGESPLMDRIRQHLATVAAPHHKVTGARMGVRVERPVRPGGKCPGPDTTHKPTATRWAP